MQYIIHLGVHNTASTLLQHNLTENVDHLRAQGVFYANAEWPQPVRREAKMLHNLHDPQAEAPSPDDFAHNNAALTRRAHAMGANRVLISDDTRLGPTMNEQLARGATNPTFYPNAAASLALSLTGLPLEDTKLLLYTRNPESYLLSLYSDAIETAQCTLTVEEFCRAVNFNSIDFDTLESALTGLHPGLTVKSRQYERIKLGAETYVRSFLRDIGLDPKPFDFKPVPLPAQLDAMQVEALLHIMAGSRSKRWRMIKELRDQVIAGAPNPLAPLTLPAWVSDSMRVTAEGRASDAARSVA